MDAGVEAVRRQVAELDTGVERFSRSFRNRKSQSAAVNTGAEHAKKAIEHSRQLLWRDPGPFIENIDSGALFRGDFGSLYTDRGLEVLDRGFLPRDGVWDDLTYWILAKPAG